MSNTAIAYREEFLDHETGQHPENYKRLTSILDKLHSKSYFKELIQPQIREATEEEIQDFQKEKMAKLNILKIPIVLKIKQLQNLIPNENEIKKH
jgi:acetoin utilization deacetylase AcuC-like enzyme